MPARRINLPASAYDSVRHASLRTGTPMGRLLADAWDAHTPEWALTVPLRADVAAVYQAPETYRSVDVPEWLHSTLKGIRWQAGLPMGRLLADAWRAYVATGLPK